MENYYELYLTSVIASGDATAALSFFILGLARIFPIIQMSPFFGSKLLPGPVKAALGISLYLIFLPQILITTTSAPTFNVALIFLVLKEAFVGFSIGFMMSIPFIIVQSMGMIIDHQRGGASLNVNDPTIQNQSSPLGTLFNFMLIYIFFLVDGPFYFMNGIIESYELIPVDRVLSPQFFSKDVNFWDIQIKLYNTVMVMATQLGAPAIIAILMTDMFLGIVNRMAPQVQITFLGIPLKSLLALLVLTLGFKLYNEQTVVEIFKWMEMMKKAVVSMNPNPSNL